jgi:general secretion pathway protein G
MAVPLMRSVELRPLAEARRTIRTMRAFTLIELLIVMAIVATLLTVALPRYFGSVEKSKEVTLKQSLVVMRDAIDKFYADNGRYPESLAELADKRYIRAVPVDPITESNETWIVVPPPQDGVAKGATYDVKSGAPGKTHDGVDFAAL